MFFKKVEVKGNINLKMFYIFSSLAMEYDKEENK